jgi:hypothetical protein
LLEVLPHHLEEERVQNRHGWKYLAETLALEPPYGVILPLLPSLEYQLLIFLILFDLDFLTFLCEHGLVAENLLEMYVPVLLLELGLGAV